MPVSRLLCEGQANGPDARVLVKLLAGRCEVRPFGGKYGMGNLVKGGRDALGRNTVFGLLDGDFPQVWSQPTGAPRSWIASDSVMLGWRWERKEIENYLIDPAVVTRALGANAPQTSAYTTALEAARDHLTLYQAARAALSERRRRFRPLFDSFGRERGREGHRLPDDPSEDACREGIRRCVEAYHADQIVTAPEVDAAFDLLRPEFAVGGARYDHYLAAFAGKDILWAMDADLRSFGFEGVLPFLEKVLVGIQNSLDDLGEWLPEWKALQEAVQNA
jgi:hypothetical protein